MNDYLSAVLLGIIEGVTEFLPVSSTAHLRIAQDMFGLRLDDPFWKMFAIVIQLGAVLCLPVYFRARLIDFVKTFPRGRRQNRNWLIHPLSLTLIAFVVTAGPAYLLDKKIGANLENLWVIGGALVIGGAIMWAIDALCTRPTTHDVEEMNLLQAIWIGAIQILSAVFPGTSRSMATIAAGQTAGLSRTAALEFSFFVSIPVMFAATGFKLLQYIKQGMKGEIALSAHNWLVLAIGFIVSFVVALAVVAWFMGWVRKRGFVPFAIYRIAIGLALLIYLRFAHKA